MKKPLTHTKNRLNLSPSLKRILRLLREIAVAEREFDRDLSCHHGISFSEFNILYSLHCTSDTKLSRTDLAAQIGLTVSSVTRALIPLERLEFVERQADPFDRRVWYAKLTDKGEHLLFNALITAEAMCERIIETTSIYRRN